MNPYDIFSEQLHNYENSVEKIFKKPITDTRDTSPINDFVPPKRNYFICFTNRSGSTLLAMTLAKSGVMGAPGEMFNPEPLTNARQKHGISSFKEYIDFKIRTTGKQGTFGAKVGIHQLAYLSKYGYLQRPISSPKFIYITRKDIVMQAVSLYIAWTTGAWTSNKSPQKTPEYSMNGIAQQLKAIMTTQTQFETFFAAHQIKPLRISYEGIEAELEKKSLQVCRFVGIPKARNITFAQPTLKVQRTELNNEWAERFVTEYKSHPI